MVAGGLAVATGLAALFVVPAYLYAVSGVLAVLAAGLNFGALAIAQTAPVFDAVGGEPELNEAFYETGNVEQIAFAAIGITIASAVLYTAAGIMACRTPAEEAEEIKEVEEAKDVAVKAEEAPEDAKPSI